MLTRNDQPDITEFNFAVDSVFNNREVQKANKIPVLPNQFLLLDNSFMLLLDGTQFLLLGN